MVADAEALDRERAQLELALRLEDLGPAVDVHALALGQVEPERVELAARDRDRRQAPSAGSLSVKKTFAQPACRRSSVTSPSIQTVGRRATQSATPRLNAATV